MIIRKLVIVILIELSGFLRIRKHTKVTLLSEEREWDSEGRFLAFTERQSDYGFHFSDQFRSYIEVFMISLRFFLANSKNGLTTILCARILVISSSGAWCVLQFDLRCYVCRLRWSEKAVLFSTFNIGALDGRFELVNQCSGIWHHIHRQVMKLWNTVYESQRLIWSFWFRACEGKQIRFELLQNCWICVRK